MLLPVLFVCAPLVAVAANYMAYKIGFFIGGSALAAIIASGFAFAMYPDRLQGAHAANMGQTAASACGTLSGLIAVMLQAFYWIGAGDDFNLWGMIVFTLASAMLGIGIGMLQTPLLVDRMALKYPTGFSVYKILRSLMDPEQLRRAFKWLFGGIAGGFITTAKAPAILARNHFDAGVFGAGLIVGPSIVLPALMGGVIGVYLTPGMTDLGWLDESHPTFRHVAFFAGLAMILGAAIIDVGFIIRKGTEVYRGTRDAAGEDYKVPSWVKTWTFLWAIAAVATGWLLLGLNPFYLLIAVGLSFVFVLVNGLSTGIADANPVTGAFVLTILILVFMAGIGDKAAALMTGTMVLMTIGSGVDMQQDRSTGRRLRSDRNMQFFFQVPGAWLGVAIGFILGPYFLTHSPELQIPSDVLTEQSPELAANWSSAFTMKIVGALKMIDGYKGHEITLLIIGLLLGMGVEILRLKMPKALKKSSILNTLLLPNPYAFAFATFVPFIYTCWFAFGGVCKGIIDWQSGTEEDDDEIMEVHTDTQAEPEEGTKPLGVPPLLGGGFIAGAGIAYLWIGLSDKLMAFLGSPPTWFFVAAPLTLVLLAIWQIRRKPAAEA